MLQSEQVQAAGQRMTGSRAPGLIRTLGQEVPEGFEQKSTMIALLLAVRQTRTRGQVQTQGDQ